MNECVDLINELKVQVMTGQLVAVGWFFGIVMLLFSVRDAQ